MFQSFTDTTTNFPENNFSFVVAKGVFLTTTHKLMPHIKEKKKTLHPPAADFQLKKKEKREKENEEGRKLRPKAGLDLAGHQDLRLGLASVFLGFFPFGGFGFFLWFLG
jgi:hypothetical protein